MPTLIVAPVTFPRTHNIPNTSPAHKATPPSPAHLHGVGEHSSESERDLLWEFLSRHGNLETVSKVDVEYPASQSVQHQIRGVPGGRGRGRGREGGWREGEGGGGCFITITESECVC